MFVVRNVSTSISKLILPSFDFIQLTLLPINLQNVAQILTPAVLIQPYMVTATGVKQLPACHQGPLPPCCSTDASVTVANMLI